MSVRASLPLLGEGWPVSPGMSSHQVSVNPLCWSQRSIFSCSSEDSFFSLSIPLIFPAFISFHLCKSLPWSVCSVSLSLSLCLCHSVFLLSLVSVPLFLFLYCSLRLCFCLSSQTFVFMSFAKDPVTFMSHKHSFMKNLKTTRNASLTAYPGARSRKLQLPSMPTASSSAVRSRKQKHSLSFSKCL